MRMSGKSGIGTFLDEIIPFLKNSSHELCFVSPKIEPFSLKEIFCFPKDELARINSCDAYFTPYCNIPGGIKIPVYSTIHDVVFLDVPGLAGTIGTMARKWFYKRAVKKSKAIFTVSEFSKKRIIHHLKCKKDIHVVHNGVPSYFDNVEPSQEKDNYILFIGNIKKHKGLSILLEAFSKVLESKADLKLLIVGSNKNLRTSDTTLYDNINSINASHKDSVSFTGFVENEQLKELICKAKILVQPSLYEGFGIPPLQALKCGTNTVISDIEVFKEIYGKLPVVFFKSEDAYDLSEKIIESLDKAQPILQTELYSYEITAKKILECMLTYCK